MIEKLHQYVYISLTWGFWIIYIISFTGVAVVDPSYLSVVDMLAKLYLAVLLLIRFNPFSINTKFTSFDKQLAWNAGLFLFLSSTMVNAVQRRLLNYIAFK